MASSPPLGRDKENGHSPVACIQLPAGDSRRVLEWLLVLSAVGIPHSLTQPDDGTWQIQVAAEDLERARQELFTYETENEHWPPPPPTDPPRIQNCGWSAAWTCMLLTALYGWTGPFRPDNPLTSRAALTGVDLANGEWWRLVTALGIHADPPHLAANLVSTLVFGSAAATVFGGGLTWLGALLASATAHYITVSVFRQPTTISFGASTGVFALLGLLIGQRLMLAISHPQAMRKRDRFRLPHKQWLWKPLGASVAIFAILGTAPDSDVTAHFWGLLCGIALGTLLQYFKPGRIPVPAQRICELMAFGLFMYAWRQVLLATR